MVPKLNGLEYILQSIKFAIRNRGSLLLVINTYNRPSSTDGSCIDVYYKVWILDIKLNNNKLKEYISTLNVSLNLSIIVKDT